MRKKCVIGAAGYHGGWSRDMDLDAYFKRIGYTGSAQPTLDTLHALSAAHVASIPFENLDVVLGRGVDISEEAVADKLIARRRGGYCFEQNSLFMRVLLAMGYDVTPISARVRIGRTREETPARTHMFLRVPIGGVHHLADVGVGGLSLTSALELAPDVEQATPHERRRLVRHDGLWFHQALLGDTWTDVCEFTLEVMPEIDRVVANWYTSTHPFSHFRHRVLVARAIPGGRLTLLNRELTRRHVDGVSTTQHDTMPALLATLKREFDLDFSPDTVFDCEGLRAP
jgi:N-hydroxyarylamine O-acetyltransferase